MTQLLSTPEPTPVDDPFLFDQGPVTFSNDNASNDDDDKGNETDKEHEPGEQVKYNIFVYNSLYYFSNF